jgi:hypothetical protein
MDTMDTMDTKTLCEKGKAAAVFPAGQRRKGIRCLSLTFALFCASLSGAAADGLAFSGLFDMKSGGGMSEIQARRFPDLTYTRTSACRSG